MEIKMYEYNIGDSVVLCMPSTHEKPSRDPITDLNIPNFFYEMDGGVYTIAERRRSPKGFNRYSFFGTFKDKNGCDVSLGGYIFDEYWLSPNKELDVQSDVDFY